MRWYSKFMKGVSLIAVSKIHKRKVCIKLPEPVVSFTFDDVPRSAVLNGESILRKYNFSGTYYISSGLMLKDGFDFGREDCRLLGEIINRGGELACHTYSHLHFFGANRNQVVLDLDRNQEFIAQCIPGYKFENFSYPYGEQTSAARDIIKSRFASARSVYHGVNSGETDLNCLKGIRLYESIDPNKIIGIINGVMETGGWIIFYTHDVEKNPSKNGCSPEYFETIVKYCFDKKIKVLPVNKVVAMLKNEVLNK
jgi:peptidoglycan/xylan/chitin deacetylase (PgdA/CDA1 family)